MKLTHNIFGSALIKSVIKKDMREVDVTDIVNFNYDFTGYPTKTMLHSKISDEYLENKQNTRIENIVIIHMDSMDDTDYRWFFKRTND